MQIIGLNQSMNKVSFFFLGRKALDLSITNSNDWCFLQLNAKLLQHTDLAGGWQSTFLSFLVFKPLIVPFLFMEERNFEAQKYNYKTFRLTKPLTNSLLVKGTNCSSLAIT